VFSLKIVGLNKVLAIVLQFLGVKLQLFFYPPKICAIYMLKKHTRTQHLIFFKD